METNQESNESNDQNMNENSEEGKAKQWLQDNMRIIISILIVILIAGGIYSYSKRTEAPQMEDQDQSVSLNEENAANEEQGAIMEENQNQSQEENSQQNVETPNNQEQTSSVATSQETEGSFVETAVRGDSKTTLARKALADYLEKNPDSALTAEHKVYIEDYLRKNVQYNGRVFVGTSVEFSKNMIKNAIDQSKGLSEGQLQNLHKYALRVPSLS